MSRQPQCARCFVNFQPDVTVSGWQADVLSPASSMTHRASQTRMSVLDQPSELLCRTRCWYSLLHVYLRHRRFHFSFFLNFHQKGEAKHEKSKLKWTAERSTPSLGSGSGWWNYAGSSFLCLMHYVEETKRKRKEKRWMRGKTSPNSSLTFVALVMAERRSRGWKMLFASRRLISLPQTTINPGRLWLISRGQRENKWQMGSGWVRYLSCAGSTPEASSLRRRLQVSVGLGPADGSWPRPRFVGD